MKTIVALSNESLHDLTPSQKHHIVQSHLSNTSSRFEDVEVNTMELGAFEELVNQLCTGDNVPCIKFIWYEEEIITAIKIIK